MTHIPRQDDLRSDRREGSGLPGRARGATLAALATTAAVFAVVAYAGAAQATQTTPKTVWDGVYSEAQAARGKAAVGEHCAVCHLEDLSGDAITMSPALVGADFLAGWDGMNLDELFTLIKTTMPQQEPGSLTDDIYRDALAFTLQVNKFPAGPDELKAASAVLKEIKILKAKP